MSPWALALPATGFVLGWLLAGPHRPLPATPPGARGATVIVPARNERHRLPRLLTALARSDPPPAEVVVVDDGSTDGTAEIARRAGTRVVAAEPPPGWTGKAWACQQGAGAATGDVLVFLDADTEPAPGLVGALSAAAAGGALVSAQPRHRVERFYERLSAGPALVALLGAGTGGPGARRWWRRPIAFGPAIAVSRDTYERLGGHAAVRSEITEDLALARAADRAGLAVTSFLGGDLIAYRMYPEGPGRLIEGWSKNLAAGAAATPPVRLAATVVWVTAALQAPLLGLAARDGSAVATAAVVYGLFAVQVAVLLRRIGQFGWATAAAYVVPLLVFVALFLRSLLVTARRGTVWWRGRRVAVRQ